jgi:hypothetical protein
MNINDTWSLQNAVRYSSDLFLDKSYTNFQWSLLLDPAHSNLPLSTLQRQIKYASYDSLSVMYLHRPIVNK